MVEVRNYRNFTHEIATQILQISGDNYNMSGRS